MGYWWGTRIKKGARRYRKKESTGRRREAQDTGQRKKIGGYGSHRRRKVAAGDTAKCVETQGQMWSIVVLAGCWRIYVPV